MVVILSDSPDAGRTWGPWRTVAMPENIGPPSLTSPLLRLAERTLC